MAHGAHALSARRHDRAAWWAALIAAVDTGVYVFLTTRQDTAPWARVSLIAASLLAAASALAVAQALEGWTRLLLLVLAAFTLLIWTFLGAFSIGVLLAPAALLALVAAERAAARVPVFATWTVVVLGAAAAAAGTAMLVLSTS